MSNKPYSHNPNILTGYVSGASGEAIIVDSSGHGVTNTNGMYISSDKVGITNSTPNATLHIGSSANVGSSANPAIQIGGAGTYRLGMYTDAEGAIIENANGDDGLQFKVKTAGEVMRLTTAGTVGIGTDDTTTGFVSIKNTANVSGLYLDCSDAIGPQLGMIIQGSGTPTANSA